MEYNENMLDVERVIKSPFADCNAILFVEPHLKVKFRREWFSIRYYYYECEKTKERFTTETLEDFNITQLYKKYEKKHNVKLNL